MASEAVPESYLMEETKSWLTEEFLKSVVKSSTEAVDEITILDHTVQRAVEVGKNFTSTVYKVKLNYKHKTDIRSKRYVIKQLIPAAISWFGMKETDTYRILPEIEQLTKDKIAPTVYMSTELETVMQDLGEEGFRNPVLKLLDYDHTVLVIKALGKFHAGTVRMHLDDPKLIEEKIGSESFTFIQADNDVEFYEKSFLMFADLIAEWPESARHADSVRQAAARLSGYFADIPRRTAFRVLNHGDLWINNMLFRYEEDGPREVRFIDYQMVRYAPPTADIHYFLGSSIDLHVKLHRLEEIYTLYLDTLNTALAELDVLYVMTREEFDENMRADNVFHIIGIVSPLGAVLADAEDKFTLEDFQEGEGAMDECVRKFAELMKSQEFKKHVIPVLDDLEKQGMFESFRD